jgi:hypothetical protein
MRLCYRGGVSRDVDGRVFCTTRQIVGGILRETLRAVGRRRLSVGRHKILPSIWR